MRITAGSKADKLSNFVWYSSPGVHLSPSTALPLTKRS